MAKLIRHGFSVCLLRVLFLAFVLFFAGPGWMQMVHAQSLPPDFPTTLIRDAFNRANGAIGTAWNGNKTGYAINANRLDVGTGGYLLWRTPSFGTTQEVYVTLSAIDPAAGEIALLLKSQGNSTWTKGVIKVIYHPDIQRVQVFTYTSTGGWVQQGADIDQAFANGDRFGAKATVSGQVVIYRNTTQVAAVDIRSWSLYTKGGYIGLWFTNASNMLVDDFGGGTWVQPTPTRTSSSTPTITQTLVPSLTPSPLPSDTPTPAPSATPLPSDTPTPVPSATPLPSDTPTPVPSATLLPSDTPTTAPSATPELSATPTPLPTVTSEPLVTPTLTSQPPATTGHFAIGPGGSDVIPHQVVRTNDDRVFVFAYRGDLSNQLTAYWTSQVGVPTEAAQFTAATPYTQPAVIISVETVYDGLNTIHVLFNSTDGTLRDLPFDIPTLTYRPVRVLDEGLPSTNTNVGTSGISAGMDAAGVLHIAYWSSGDHITYRAYTYDRSADNLTASAGPTQLDLTGHANHPSLAISPLDGSVTVAWISQEVSPATIQVRTRGSAGWSAPETVSASPVWTSPNFGVNIDQGPSLIIGANGARHLAYIEDFRQNAPYDYGRIHYVLNNGSIWVDTYTGFYSHDPALALNSSGDLYIIGHGYPLNSPPCLSIDDMCVYRMVSPSAWEQTLLAEHQSNTSYDSSPSAKWAAVGFNRSDVIEFVFPEVLGGNYSNTVLHYGWVGPVGATQPAVSSTPLPSTTPTLEPSATVLPSETPTPLPSSTPEPTAIPSPLPSATPSLEPSPTPSDTFPPTQRPSATLSATPSSTLLPSPTPSAIPSSTVVPSPTASLTLAPTATLSGSFPSKPILDTFDRANGSLGTSWSGTTGGYTIASNRLDVTSGGDIYWKAPAFGPDQEVFVTLTQIDTAASEIDLLLKAQSNTYWGNGVIEVWYDPVNKRAQVYTFTTLQNWVQRGTDIPIALTNGDQFGARATADGKVHVYKNGILVGTRDVSAWPFYSQGGYIGFWFIDAPNMLLENFGGG